jgi:hypothetical protein
MVSKNCNVIERICRSKKLNGIECNNNEIKEEVDSFSELLADVVLCGT